MWVRVLTLGLLLPLAGCSADPPVVKGPDDGSTTAPAATSKTPPTGLVFLVPRPMPPGFSVLQADVRREGEEPATYTAAVGRPAGPGGAFDRVMRVSVVAATTDREVGDEERAQLRMVDVGGGRRARLSDLDATGAAVDWFQDGRAIAVHGPAGAGDVIVDVARRLRFGRTAADSTLAGVPTGDVLIGEGRTGGFPRERSTLSATGPSAASFHVTVQVVPPGTFPLEAMVIGDSARRVRLGDRDVVTGGRRTSVAGTTIEQHSFAWMARPDLLVTVQTAGVDEGGARRLVESLTPASEEEHRALAPRP